MTQPSRFPANSLLRLCPCRPCTKQHCSIEIDMFASSKMYTQKTDANKTGDYFVIPIANSRKFIPGNKCKARHDFLRECFFGPRQHLVAPNEYADVLTGVEIDECTLDKSKNLI